METDTRADAPAEQDIELLHRISQALGYDLSFRDVLQIVVNLTAEMMDSKVCSILLYDEPAGELAIAATQSLSDDYRNKPNIQLGSSVSGLVVKTRKPVMVRDVTREPAYGFKEVAQREGIVSMLCVPMLLKNRVIGVINSYTSRPHDYTPREVRLLSLVAGQAAIAIENARLDMATTVMRQDLESRRLIDRAKGLLMASLSLTEPEAFRKIQKQSMNTRKPMRQIAEAIILAHEVGAQQG